jgi:hypothetical protein
VRTSVTVKVASRPRPSWPSGARRSETRYVGGGAATAARGGAAAVATAGAGGGAGAAGAGSAGWGAGGSGAAGLGAGGSRVVGAGAAGAGAATSVGLGSSRGGAATGGARVAGTAVGSGVGAGAGSGVAARVASGSDGAGTLAGPSSTASKCASATAGGGGGGAVGGGGAGASEAPSRGGVRLAAAPCEGLGTMRSGNLAPPLVDERRRKTFFIAEAPSARARPPTSPCVIPVFRSGAVLARSGSAPFRSKKKRRPNERISSTESNDVSVYILMKHNNYLLCYSRCFGSLFFACNL